MGLRLKFNLAMLGALLIGIGVGSLIVQRVVYDNARQEVLQNARIMMSAANAIRNYTGTELVPILSMEHDGNFVPQTVPSYSAQRNFREIQAAFPGYSYREAALNPTNLSDRALDWEADIINLFRNENNRDELIAERPTSTGPMLHMARPISVRQESCLTCHSSPSIAPAAMTREYGLVNGFGWKLHEIVGAQILTVPMALPLKLAREAFMSFLVTLVAVCAAIAIAMNILLHYAVIRPVKRVSAMAEAVSLGSENVESYVKPGKDEISSLSLSFDRMRKSLDHAIRMLGNS